jgi:hypothetical protein
MNPNAIVGAVQNFFFGGSAVKHTLFYCKNERNTNVDS